MARSIARRRRRGVVKPAPKKAAPKPKAAPTPKAKPKPKAKAEDKEE